MGYCVFMLRHDSLYDDSPAEQYQFPGRYLSRAQNAVGDWIVYLEPKKVRASRGYFAVARVQQIIPDPKAPDMFLALIEPRSYLDFPNPVSHKDEDGYVESGLVNEYGKLSGNRQSAVRDISSSDFLRILDKGLGDADSVLPREDTRDPATGLEDGQTPYLLEDDRLRVEHLVSRPVRDRAFRRVVLHAYDARCALTGLKFINGGGRAEVDAAHIMPVEHNGPDIIHNGLALSGTAHWMFDRGLLSLSDDLEILISRQVNDPSRVKAFINRDGCATPPNRSADRPNPRFLSWHRENCFKS